MAYENPWIEVTHREVVTPTGTDGIYGVVHMKSLAIGIIPVDTDGFTWLVGQYRYACDEWSWEIPAGGGPIGPDPVETARRELREECGLSANTIDYLMTAHTSNSVTDEVAHIYVATDVTLGQSEPDETEVLEVRRLPLPEAVAMVLRGEITDSLSVMGLLRLAAQRGDLGGEVGSG